MAEAIVSAVAERLGNLLVEEAIYLNDVSDKVRDLQTELGWMQCYLKDAEQRQNDSAIVKNGIAETKDLAYEAEDVIANYALKVESRKGRSVQKFLKRCACILEEGITVHQLGSKIDAIKTRISNLKDSFEKYGITRTTMQAGEPQPEQRKTYSHPEANVVGFKEDLNKLVESLLKEEEGNTRVASICGMGGLGKTTLAKMIYNHPDVKKHFSFCAWVCISQQCQQRAVWEEIMINLLPQSQNDQKDEKIEDQKDGILPQSQRDKIKGWSNEELIRKLRQVQQEQKCLIVLDDIWNMEHWDVLSEAFPVEDTKSKILLTSRISEVVLHSDPRGFHHNLACLHPEESWELFEKLAISWRPDIETKTYMQTLGKEMIGCCADLPLAITVLGGLLATKKTMREWEDVHKHVKSYLHEEQNLRVKKVLALSYYDLPSHLKPCFLYLGHFPEDFDIPTKELIRMWMGEGFLSQIQHRGGREGTMDDVGYRYIRELVQRYMVMGEEQDSLGSISIRTCRLHDLMRDFCVSKAQEENFLHITDTLSMKRHEAQIGKVRRLAIIPSDDFDSRIKFNEYPDLRSLLHLLPHGHGSYFEESCFKKFKMVRVLHLKNFKKLNGELPKDIGCLIHLRYLSLKDSNINKVPSSISNLRCLETLDLRIVSELRMPNMFKYMKQLKHLYLPEKYEVRCKLELGTLSHLQTLKNVRPETIEIPASFKFDCLLVLEVRTIGSAQDVLQMLISSCAHLDRLYIWNPMRNIPKAQYSSCITIFMVGLTRLQEDPMPTLEQLPNLKILRLGNNSFYGKNMYCSRGGFPSLQDLRLHKSYIEEWTVEEGAMRKLRFMEVCNCDNLRTLPDGLRFVTTLQELHIDNNLDSFREMHREGGPSHYIVEHVRTLIA